MLGVQPNVPPPRPPKKVSESIQYVSITHSINLIRFDFDTLLSRFIFSVMSRSFIAVHISHSLHSYCTTRSLLVAEWSSDDEDDEDGDEGSNDADDDPIHIDVVDEEDMAALRRQQADKFRSARSSVLLGFSMDQVCACV